MKENTNNWNVDEFVKQINRNETCFLIGLISYNNYTFSCVLERLTCKSERWSSVHKTYICLQRLSTEERNMCDITIL